MITPADATTPRRRLPVLHQERHLAVDTGGWVWVACECNIGRDHTYGDWIDRFQRTRAGSLEELVDMYDSDPANVGTYGLEQSIT